MNKKAVTPAISYILLIGLSVAMAGVVTVWVKSTASSSSEKVISNVDKDLRCDDTSLNAYEETTTNCASLKIQNRGFFSLWGIKVRSANGIDDIQFQSPLKPQEMTTINLNTIPANNKISIIPVINVKDGIMACMTKEISVECKT